MGRNLNWALDPRKPRKASTTTATQVTTEQTSTKQSTENNE